MTETIMEKLKERTRPLHDSAESHAFQGRLARATLTPGTYARYLGQLYLIHAALEASLRLAAASCQPIAAAVSAEQYNEGFLRDDLTALGCLPGSISPLAPTGAFIAEIGRLAADCPVALLGVHYVLLGSKHGGRLIARNLEQAYGLTGSGGATYFDPYGSRFMDLWLSFKKEMNTASLAEADFEAMAQAAAATFRAIGAIGDELLQDAF